jgi:hypothetical protein
MANTVLLPIANIALANSGRDLVWRVQTIVDYLNQHPIGAGGGNGVPGGVNTDIQFNQSNTFGGNSNFRYVFSNNQVIANLTFQVTNTGVFILPVRTNPWGNGNGISVMSAIPGGDNTTIQFNDSGVFGGNDALTFDKTKTQVLLRGTHGRITLSGANTGPDLGVETNPYALLAVESNTDNVILQGWYNQTLANTERALTVFQADTGEVYYELRDDLFIFSYGGSIELSGNNIELTTAYGNNGNHGRLAGLWAPGALAPSCHTYTGNTTIDSGVGSGAEPYFTHNFKITSAKTCTLPALTANNISPNTERNRIIIVKNDHTSTGLLSVVCANASHTINGDTSRTLWPGYSIVLQAEQGSYLGWKVIASHADISGDAEVNVFLDNDDIKALPTTPILLVPALGDLWRPKLTVPPSIHFSFTNANSAYTNIDPDWCAFVITGSPGSGGTGHASNNTWLTCGVYNDSTVPVYNANAFFGTVHDGVVDLPIPYMQIATGDWSPQPPSAHSWSSFSNAAIWVSVDNNGAGNFTAGYSTNYVRIKLYYKWEYMG